MDLKCTNAFLDVIEMHQTFWSLPHYLSLLKMSMHVGRHPPQNAFPCRGEWGKAATVGCRAHISGRYPFALLIVQDSLLHWLICQPQKASYWLLMESPWKCFQFLSYRALQRSMSLLFESIKLSPNYPQNVSSLNPCLGISLWWFLVFASFCHFLPVKTGLNRQMA